MTLILGVLHRLFVFYFLAWSFRLFLDSSNLEAVFSIIERKLTSYLSSSRNPQKTHGKNTMQNRSIQRYQPFKDRNPSNFLLLWSYRTNVFKRKYDMAHSNKNITLHPEHGKNDHCIELKPSTIILCRIRNTVLAKSPYFQWKLSKNKLVEFIFLLQVEFNQPLL